MTEVVVLEDDITQTPADGLITGVNETLRWLGAVDQAIMNCAGEVFHRQTSNRGLKRSGDTVYTTYDGRHDGKFASVVFVVDNFDRPLQDIVYAALLEADRQRLEVVTLPVMRTGSAFGMYEQSEQAVLDEMAAGIRRFLEAKPLGVRQIKVIAYKNPGYARHLRSILGT